MTSVNLDVTTVEISKKSPKQPWYERWSLFPNGKGKSQNSKKRKERLSSTSEVISTSSVESTRVYKSVVSTTSNIPEASNNRKEGSFKSKSVVGQSTSQTSTMECLLCLTSQPAEDFPSLSMCPHQTCLNCFRQYLKVEITESRVNLTCPACQEKLHPSDVISILQDDTDLLSKWEEFLLRRTLSTDPDCRWCPAPDCGYAVIAYGCAGCPRLTCKRPGCNTEFCYHCRQEWHHNQTCDSAHLQRTKQLRIRTNSGAYSQGSGDEIKPCPKCGAFIVKMNDGSCNHMTCAVCEAEFCWLCLQEITDLHYLSPSGCTFWGKKPWSRKKKILWQLGLLIGAPLGIALVAGVAVPAIIIGLPVWVGKKVVGKLRKHNASKHQKNLAAVGAVSASVILSPALAALAVGIGVPVMLLYVYGVVPISLCRTGSVSGVKGQPPSANMAAMLPASFRLDAGTSGGSTREPRPQEEVATFHVTSSNVVPANPSIGEASVEGMTMGSLNMSHGSNLDKIGRGDHDGASTVAMAGTSITGSISGISGSGCNPMSRIEIHLKDTDQHSIQTHTSVGSNAMGFTSVQVHMNDNVSLHSTTGLPSTSRSNTIRSYSSKRSTGKGKAKTSKCSSVQTTSTKNPEEVTGSETCSSSIKEEEASTILTIVDETYDASVVADSPDFDQSLKQDVDITCPASGDDGNIISVL